MSAIAQKLKIIHQKITAATAISKRAAGSVELIAVSKGHAEESVRDAIKAGQNIFGENRVQEAQNKFKNLRSIHAPLELHLIGPLQTNKAEDAVKIFDVIQTIDRPNLAEALAKAIKKSSRKPRLYIEVNIGLEPQKAGILPGEFDIFLKFCRESCSLTIEGLMCIPPQSSDPRPYFIQLKNLADQHGLKHISMGMSSDFEAAVACGATEVRVGTALFGERAAKP